jgi:acetyl-CoA carboxylase carboxyl transferase subunit alpha
VIDGIVVEPAGGAHRDPDAAVQAAGDAVDAALTALSGFSREEIRAKRADKFLAIGRKP